MDKKNCRKFFVLSSEIKLHPERGAKKIFIFMLNFQQFRNDKFHPSRRINISKLALQLCLLTILTLA